MRMGFVQLRALRHAVAVVRGKYDNPNDEGEVSHFQALTAALSATVGLGNIAGVAIAIAVGGPGATFWMILAGFLGMASKFTECTLGQTYRKQRPDGHVMGCYVLPSPTASRTSVSPVSDASSPSCSPSPHRRLLGGGNSFQVNQSMKALEAVIPTLSDYNWA
ncbi:MAG: alanine:cation symporter family protein [Planctomycetota bacterium]